MKLDMLEFGLSRDLYRWNVNTLRAGSCAFDFTQLRHWKCFGTKEKTESELKLSFFIYVVPRTFWSESHLSMIRPLGLLVSKYDNNKIILLFSKEDFCFKRDSMQYEKDEKVVNCQPKKPQMCSSFGCKSCVLRSPNRKNP